MREECWSLGEVDFVGNMAARPGSRGWPRFDMAPGLERSEDGGADWNRPEVRLAQEARSGSQIWEVGADDIWGGTT